VDATPEALEAILHGSGAVELCEIEAGGRYEAWAGVLHLPVKCGEETSLHGFDWTVWADLRLEKGSRTWKYAGCFGGILGNLKLRAVTDHCAKVVLQVRTPMGGGKAPADKSVSPPVTAPLTIAESDSEGTMPGWPRRIQRGGPRDGRPGPLVEAVEPIEVAPRPAILDNPKVEAALSRDANTCFVRRSTWESARAYVGGDPGAGLPQVRGWRRDSMWRLSDRWARGLLFGCGMVGGNLDERTGLGRIDGVSAESFPDIVSYLDFLFQPGTHRWHACRVRQEGIQPGCGDLAVVVL
jgi:hypothetical protein